MVAFNRARRSRFSARGVEMPLSRDNHKVDRSAVLNRMARSKVTLDTYKVKRYTLKARIAQAKTLFKRHTAKRGHVDRDHTIGRSYTNGVWALDRFHHAFDPVAVRTTGDLRRDAAALLPWSHPPGGLNS